jgi:hypothetical protein
MLRAASLWTIVLVLVLAASLFVSCRDDVEVPLPPSINGNYVGTYHLVEIVNSVDTNTDTTQAIEFTFRKPDFSMDIDPMIPESLRVFCDVLGTYVLGNGVTMTVTDSNYTRGVCTESWAPGGFFSLDQTTDTVRLKFDVTNNVNGDLVRIIKELKLLRAVL